MSADNDQYCFSFVYQLSWDENRVLSYLEEILIELHDLGLEGVGSRLLG